ncbi:ras guanine nucleotide exchange factor domain-containing protein [Gymnopilus junonius]|uniref:Ras guanine nucleotide exchange factor domain-containing protein n=1 Tax=Gymnopilus junonius TaxID=109634 RepID=A0A9P5NTF4_GYMJU|nr:ras guanine nucleotide exchange factor domain-containing protein [Gymnopilus junonius]
MHSRLAIDTTIGMTAGPSSVKTHVRQRSISPSFRPAGPSHGIQQRGRSVSNASTTSSLSIVSPTSSSTNASTTSLSLPNSRSRSRSRSASPAIEETVRFGQEYVLALHDYVPPPQNTTCLSFRAGQVIHVLSRDQSGWWDGELEGRRGWFPSNYVSNMEITSLTEEEPLGMRSANRGHTYTQSSSSATSWATIASKSQPLHNGHEHELSITDPLEADKEDDPYCPPLMVPLLHGLSLLQNAVRSNRVAHFQPSTACIISCVRSILASTETLQRDAPVLQRFPELSDARKKILTILAALVAQAKKASDTGLEGDARELEVDNMLRLGAQVFSHVRTFLTIAIKCGVELPEDQDAVRTATPGSASGQAYIDSQEDGSADSPTRTPTQHRGRNPHAIMSRPGARIAGPRSRERPPDPPSSPGLSKSLARAKQEQYLLRDREHKGHKSGPSIDSISSNSSISSQDSIPSSPPPFPRGPSTAAQVMDALRFTHDHYLSTIAAFIGHAHSHSRTSYASSTGVLYDLVKEIVDMVCKLLTLVEAVMQHPDIPLNRVGNLRSAKEGLYNVTSALAESVRLLTLSLPPTMSEEEEKQVLLRSATAALKAGADCVAAVKVCLNRSAADKSFIVNLPDFDEVNSHPFTPMKSLTSAAAVRSTANLGVVPSGFHLNGMEDEDLTIQAQTPSPIQRSREISSGSDVSNTSKSSYVPSEDTRATSPDEERQPERPPPIILSSTPVEPDLASPTSFAHTDDDGTTWEGSARGHHPANDLGEKIIRGELPSLPMESIPEFAQDPSSWMFGHDYALDDVAYNSEGHLVGATMDVLVEKMTPHDSIVDPAFAAVFFLTFRLFSSPSDLVDAVIYRYNLLPPLGISNEDLHLWQQRKGIPVRLRVSNFIKMWVELYWRPGVDDVALAALTTFTRDGLATLFPGPASRILDLLNMRKQSSDLNISPKADRTRDPGMSINPPTAITPTTEIPRPTMTKTLLVALRKKDFSNIVITDFDALELARQLTIMECHLYCAIQPEEILESGQEGATPPVNVRAVSSLSTVITGWVAESILNEPDIKKRTLLVKFFVKVADRCTGLNNFSTSRSILAALDSSVISRLRLTWNGLPQKYKAQLESLRRLADHSRNYHEYRSKLRNTAPPAVPFLGLYLTDVTFCREGNPSHRASPTDPRKKLLNFNKYHKLARIVQDMQRFQSPYNLKAIPEVQEYLNVAFENSKHHGDLQDLYRRSLLVEPKQPADNPPVSDMRQLFNWATRSQAAS